MAASIWRMGWRAGTASLDPSILDTENRDVGGGRADFYAYVTDVWSVPHSGCIFTSLTPKSLCWFSPFSYLPSPPRTLASHNQMRHHNWNNLALHSNQVNLFIIKPSEIWLLHNVHRHESYK